MKEKELLWQLWKVLPKMSKIHEKSREVKARNLKQELEIESLKRTQDILIERNVSLSLELEKKEKELGQTLIASKESFNTTNN